MTISFKNRNRLDYERRMNENLLVKIYHEKGITGLDEKIILWFKNMFNEELYWLGNVSHSYKSEYDIYINEQYIEFLPRTKEQAMLLKLVWSNAK